LYLTNIERKLSGDCQPFDGDGLESMVHSDLEGTHEIVGRESERMSLTRVVDLDGHQVAEKLDYDESLFFKVKLSKCQIPAGRSMLSIINKETVLLRMSIAKRYVLSSSRLSSWLS
jgi:hypothetical protein